MCILGKITYISQFVQYCDKPTAIRSLILPRVRNPFSDSAVSALSAPTITSRCPCLRSHHFLFIHQNIPAAARHRTQIDLDFETNPIPDLHLNEGPERGYTL